MHAQSLISSLVTFLFFSITMGIFSPTIEMNEPTRRDFQPKPQQPQVSANFDLALSWAPYT